MPGRVSRRASRSVPRLSRRPRRGSESASDNAKLRRYGWCRRVPPVVVRASTLPRIVWRGLVTGSIGEAWGRGSSIRPRGPCRHYLRLLSELHRMATRSAADGFGGSAACHRRSRRSPRLRPRCVRLALSLLNRRYGGPRGWKHSWRPLAGDGSSACWDLCGGPPEPERTKGGPYRAYRCSSRAVQAVRLASEQCFTRSIERHADVAVHTDPFVIAGTAKLRDRGGTRETAAAFGVPRAAAALSRPVGSRGGCHSRSDADAC